MSQAAAPSPNSSENPPADDARIAVLEHCGIDVGKHDVPPFAHDARELARQGDGIPVDTRADLRLSNPHAVMTAATVIDSLYTLAGGSSVYLKSPLQRHFRDIHVATQHMMVNEATLELVGRIQLGQETDTNLL